MPRCGAEGRIIRPQQVTLKVRNEEGQEVDLVLDDPWVFKLLDTTEWHPDDGQENIDPSITISVPAMTLVAPRGQGAISTLYAPSSSTSQQRAIVGKMFGTSDVRTYSNTLSISDSGAWQSYYCFFGENQSGAVMGDGTANEVKGGWAISVPDGVSTNGMIGDQVNLFPDSFAIIGASYGGLFGGNRKLYFLNGVNTAGQFSGQVRSDFGFTLDQGNAQIVVNKLNLTTDQDWKILVTP